MAGAVRNPFKERPPRKRLPKRGEGEGYGERLPRGRFHAERLPNPFEDPDEDRAVARGRMKQKHPTGARRRRIKEQARDKKRERLF